MSEENVALARRTYEAFNRGDFDAVVGLFDREVEVHDPPEMPDATVHHGIAAVRRDWERTFESFEEFTIEIEECEDLGDDRLLLWLRYRGRGRGSGASVDAFMAHLVTLRDGKLLKLHQFLDREQALEAARAAR